MNSVYEELTEEKMEILKNILKNDLQLKIILLLESDKSYEEILEDIIKHVKQGRGGVND